VKVKFRTQSDPDRLLLVKIEGAAARRGQTLAEFVVDAVKIYLHRLDPLD
jgi:uncharacterized protein (DUF1778 family)